MKCDQYWPEYGVGNYGDIDVTIVREDVLAFYTLRTFTVTQVSVNTGKKKTKKTDATVHTVYQYHYTAWPDHGVPLHALPLITFVRNSGAANTDNNPIIVHCRYSLYATYHNITTTITIQRWCWAYWVLHCYSRHAATDYLKRGCGRVFLPPAYPHTA